MCLSGSLNDYLDDLELHRHVDADGDTQLPLKYRCRGRVGRGGRLVMDRLPVYDSVWRPDTSNPGSHIRYSAFPASAAAQQNQTDPRQQAAANHAAWAGVAFPRAVSSFTHHTEGSARIFIRRLCGISTWDFIHAHRHRGRRTLQARFLIQKWTLMSPVEPQWLAHWRPPAVAAVAVAVAVVGLAVTPLLLLLLRSRAQSSRTINDRSQVEMWLLLP